MRQNPSVGIPPVRLLISMVTFHKYHGAGNDFILIDDRATDPHEVFDQQRIAALCARHVGIGADGLMLLRPHPTADFEMVYYNSDGAPSSMCGNGGRCIARFASDLGVINNQCTFVAVDGPHRAIILDSGKVSLEMADTSEVMETELESTRFVDTGSPHILHFGHDPATVDVLTEGRAIRNHPNYKATGVNVNFLRRDGEGTIHIATYERGVEAETLACGTGVTAAALGYAGIDDVPIGGTFDYTVRAKGGTLSVKGKRAEAGFTGIWLTGPTAFVFDGKV